MGKKGLQPISPFANCSRLNKMGRRMAAALCLPEFQGGSPEGTKKGTVYVSGIILPAGFVHSLPVGVSFFGRS